MGAAPQAIVFVIAMVGAVIVAFYILAFSGSALLVVIEGTAAGNDEIPWPTEPWSDVMSRAAYLAALLAMWLIPAGFLWTALREVWLPGQDALRLLLIAAPGLWLYFPLGLFSTLRSVSGWSFFRWDMFRDLCRVWPATLYVYGISALLIAGVGYVWLAALTGSPMLLLAAAPVTSMAWLIYARLLGRLGYKIGQLKPLKSAKKKPAKKDRARAVRDPWSEQEEDVYPQPVPEEPVAPKKPRSLLLDEEPEPYELSDEAPPARPDFIPLDGYEPDEVEEVAPPNPKLDRIENTNRALAARDKRLTRRKKPPKKPKWPMFEGIVNFPFYPQCLRPMVNIAVGWLVFGVHVVLMMQMNPMA